MRRVPKEILERLEYFQREVESLFTRLFESDQAGAVEPGESEPFVDLFETEREIVVRADLPGVEKEAVELFAAPDYLVFRGAKASAAASRCLRIERAHGAFQRLVTLPAAVRAEEARARMSEGVLEVRLPKVEDRRRGRHLIEIK